MMGKEPIINDLITQDTYNKLHEYGNILQELVVIEEKLKIFGVKITIDDKGFSII